MPKLPAIDATLGSARAFTQGDTLTIVTGTLQRTWRFVDGGLATTHLWDLGSKRAWTGEPCTPDWQLPDATEPTAARLISLTASTGDDEGFTSPHLCVVATFGYAQLELRWTIWAYPGVAGLRTQLAARLLDGALPVPPTSPEPARVDRLPIGPGQRRLLGYYNDTQNRNNTHEDILKEVCVTHPLQGTEWCDWANAACIEDAQGGFALVKESHKCVNQTGHASGGFVIDETAGLAATGWGLWAPELTHEWTAGWATWTLLWTGSDLARQRAFKTFDAARYPIDPARDIYIQANTWGSTALSTDARLAATEPSVIQEIDVCADLGIDILQIDDGWQVTPGNRSYEPPEGNGWHPHPQSYPQGWTHVRQRAAERGIKLGLWAAAQPISLQELLDNEKQGGFVQFKLDFARLRSRSEIDALMKKVRTFIVTTGHRVRVNWDVTERDPRYGYFYAREYGSIYLENRKPSRPLHVIYRPHTVLRDLWQIARYLNLHRFQCSIQDVDRVDPTRSDAHLHSHSYATAIALMGIPLFFLQTKYYSAAAKDEIRPLLATYKAHREAIYRGEVHPIGSKPDNASWTGFHCHLPGETQGYLTIFRERCNPDAEQSISLPGLPAGASLELADLISGATRQVTLDDSGAATFRMPTAPGFLFLQYTQR